MIKPKVAFVVYGTHKDGLADPMGQPFIDKNIVSQAKASLRAAGLTLSEYPLVLATKAEARECFNTLKKADDIDAVVLFSGT